MAGQAKTPVARKPQQAPVPVRREEKGDFFSRSIPDLWTWPRRLLGRRDWEAEDIWQSAQDVSVCTGDSDTLVRVGLPGLRREDIFVGIEGQTLVIRTGGEQRDRDPSMFIVKGIDARANSFESKYENGVLEVRIPRSLALTADQTGLGA